MDLVTPEHRPAPPDDSHQHITLNLDRHLKYHLRCIKTLLPTAYTSNDANRMMLAYFTLSSLDLLQKIDTVIYEDERASFVAWIYSCQLPSGGFRAFPGSDFGAEKRNKDNEAWDPANLAGTLFALINLLTLDNSLDGVNRIATLRWLKTMQHDDGSFGETIGTDGKPTGGSDMRYAYIATSIRHILRGEGDNEVGDIDTEKLVRFVVKSQSYDGGIGKQLYHESHAGHTFCGVSILSLLGKLPPTGPSSNKQTASEQDRNASNSVSLGHGFLERVVQWLVYRQVPEPVDNDEETDEEAISYDHGDSQKVNHTQHNVTPADDHIGPLNHDHLNLEYAGFNGRCNKPADTCYSFWIIGALDVLGHAALIDTHASRSFLLAKTQHAIGGFSKQAEQPPGKGLSINSLYVLGLLPKYINNTSSDVLHSYFGLAGLALMGGDPLKRLETNLSVSADVAKRIEGLEWKKG